jgi:hypothetical protein
MRTKGRAADTGTVSRAGLSSARGELRYVYVTEWPLPARALFGAVPAGMLDSRPAVFYSSASRPYFQWERWGFRWIDTDVVLPLARPHVRAWAVSVPHWFPAAVFGLISLSAVPRWMRMSRRLRKGLCSNCGYDLRASIARCPECGKRIEPLPATLYP